MATATFCSSCEGSFEKGGKHHVSKRDIDNLLKIHHAKLFRDLDCSIRQHLEYCFQHLSAARTFPLVPNATTPCKETELNEGEAQLLLKLPVGKTVADIDEVVALQDEDFAAHFDIDEKAVLSMQMFEKSAHLEETPDPPSETSEMADNDMDSDTKVGRDSLSKADTKTLSNLPSWQMPSHRLQQIKSLRSASYEREDSYVCKLIRALSIVPFIALNSLFVGLRIAFIGDENDHDSNMHVILDAGSLFFCALFTLELLGKLMLTGKKFFTRQEIFWNLFDAIIVVFMLLDEATRRRPEISNISIIWISALRVAHLWKSSMLLPVRHELRIMQLTVQRCLWEILVHFGIIALCTYLCALALTEASARNCVDGDSRPHLCHYFGSLGLSAYTLSAAILGGLDWGTLYNEWKLLGFLYIVLFLFFLTCVSLVLLNSCLAVIVTMRKQCVKTIDYASKHEKRQRDHYIQILKEIFEKIDINTSGTISVEEVKFALQDARLVSLLDTMKIEIDDVDRIFELLDIDGDKGIDLDEFLFGCLRIHGPAKGSDLVRVLGQLESVKISVNKIHHSIDRVLRTSEANLLKSVANPIQSSAMHQLSEFRKQQSASEPLPESMAATSTRRSRPSGSSFSASMQFRAGLRSGVDSWKKGGNARIPKVEQRAMCLEDFLDIRMVIELLCPKEVWRDSSTDEFLEVKDVNLYHFNQYVICPETLPNGATLSVVSHARFAEGDSVEQYGTGGKPLASGFIQEVLQSGKLRIRVTWGRFQEGLPHVLQVNGEDRAELRSIEADHLSYKELISQTPTDPDWFCSHWWGESILNFVSCIKRHVELRESHVRKQGYWVCAYANDQHDLGLEIGIGVESSSFRKAMRLSSGTLLLLDPGAKAFSRIWCDFEIYKTVMEGKNLDVAVCSGQDQRPKVLMQQPAPGETAHTKMKREALFPVTLLADGMRVNLELGDASVRADKDKILDTMAADFKHEDRKTALKLALSKANATLNAYFALKAWPLAILRDLVNNFDRRHPGTLKLPEVLQRDESRKYIALTFSHMQQVSNADIETLADAMPSGLEKLELHFNGCNQVTDKGLSSLTERIQMMEGLQKMHLDFTSCVQITDASLFALAGSLPPDLKELRLDFGVCSEISEFGVRDLAQHLPDTLQVFSATFKGTQFNRDFDTVGDIRRVVDSSSNQLKQRIFASLRSRVSSVSNSPSKQSDGSEVSS